MDRKITCVVMMATVVVVGPAVLCAAVQMWETLAQHNTNFPWVVAGKALVLVWPVLIIAALTLLIRNALKDPTNQEV